MKRYGYLEESDLNNAERVRQAIEDMQAFGGLEITGEEYFSNLNTKIEINF